MRALFILKSYPTTFIAGIIACGIIDGCNSENSIWKGQYSTSSVFSPSHHPFVSCGEVEK